MVTPVISAMIRMALPAIRFGGAGDPSLDLFSHPVADKLVEADKARAAPFLGGATRDLHRDQRLACSGRAADDDAIVQRGELKDWLLLIAKKPLDVLFTLLDFLARAGSALLNWQADADDGFDLRR